MGSFSKTFASNGGFVACKNRAVKEYLRFYSAPATFSNALSPVQAATVLKAFEIVESVEGRVQRLALMANILTLRHQLREAGLDYYGETNSRRSLSFRFLLPFDCRLTCKPDNYRPPRAAKKPAGTEVILRSLSYLRAAQAYMLTSMPTGTSTICGAFQAIRELPSPRHDCRSGGDRKERGQAGGAPVSGSGGNMNYFSLSPFNRSP